MLWCIFWWSLDVDDNLCSEHGNRLLKTRARTEATYCVLTMICFSWTFPPTMKTNAISPSGACWSNHCSSQSQNPKPIVQHVILRLGGFFKLKWKWKWKWRPWYSNVGLGSSLRGEPGLTTFRSQGCPWKIISGLRQSDTHRGGTRASSTWQKKPIKLL